MTTVTHALVNDSGEALTSLAVEIDLVVPGGVNAFFNNAQIISHKTTKTNSSGTWTAELLPNTLITPGGTTYKATHTFDGDEPNLVLNFVVPDSNMLQHLVDILI